MLLFVKSTVVLLQVSLMKLRKMLQVNNIFENRFCKMNMHCLALVLKLLSSTVHTAFSVGKIQVSIRKGAHGKWASLGQPLESHNTFVRQKDRGGFQQHHRCACAARSHRSTRFLHAVCSDKKRDTQETTLLFPVLQLSSIGIVCWCLRLR